MTLPAQHIAALRAAHIAAGLTTTVPVTVYQSGAALAPFNLVVEITEDQIQEVRNEDGREQVTVRRIAVRPQADSPQPVRIGDKLTYGGVVFTVLQIQGATKPKWIAEHADPIGVSSKDRFRSVGA